MHPEIVRDGPGSCPICGMALEPRRRHGRTTGRTPSSVDMSRRLLVRGRARGAAPPPGDGRHAAPGARRPRSLGRLRVLLEQSLLATPVVPLGGWPFLRRADRPSVRTRNLNMFTLIGLGIGVAYVYSLVGDARPAGSLPGLLPGRSPDEVARLLRGRRPSSPRSSSSGRCSSCGPASQTGDAIRKLLGLAAKTARRRQRGRQRRRTFRSRPCSVGDRLRVRPGEKVPGRRRRRSRGPAPSTNRWSPASRSRSRRGAGRPASSGPRSTGRARS